MRAALRHTGVLLVGALVLLGLAAPLLNGGVATLALLAVGAVTMAASYLVRGPLAGLQRYGRYAATFWIEAGVGLAGAVVLTVVDEHATAAWIAVLALAPGVAPLLLWAVVARRLGVEQGDIPDTQCPECHPADDWGARTRRARPGRARALVGRAAAGRAGRVEPRPGAGDRPPRRRRDARRRVHHRRRGRPRAGAAVPHDPGHAPPPPRRRCAHAAPARGRGRRRRARLGGAGHRRRAVRRGPRLRHDGAPACVDRGPAGAVDRARHGGPGRAGAARGRPPHPRRRPGVARRAGRAARDRPARGPSGDGCDDRAARRRRARASAHS